MATTPIHRRWPRFSLRTFLVATLLASMVLGLYGRAWWKAYRDSQPPTLYELAQIAKRHGIPMPPEGAKLVLVLEYPLFQANGPIYEYTPGFLLHDDANRAATLIGSKEETLEKKLLPKAWAPLWRKYSANGEPVDADGYSYSVDYSSPAALICAIQLYNHGEVEQAEQVLSEVLKCHESPTYPPPGFSFDATNLRLTVARCAYLNIARSIRTEPNRWPDLRKQLEALIGEFPKLQEENCGTVSRDLALAVDAPPPADGSVEELLLDWSRRNPDRAGWRPFEWVPLYDDADPAHIVSAPAREIVLRGFEAVPDLISLCRDRRLTAHVGLQDSEDSPDFRRLGELADDLLKEISGYNDVSSSLSVPFPDEVVEPDAADWEQWYAVANARGERAYLLGNLYSDNLDLPGELREPLAYILAQKYPESLFDLIHDYFHSAPLRGYVFDLVLPIRDAHLPVKQRVELLVTLFQSAPDVEQSKILCALAKLDQERAAYFTLQLLDEFPTDLDEGSPEAELATVVTMLDDQRAWTSLLKAMRSASPELRLEMLEYVADRNPEQRRRPLWLALLAAFLDDTTLGRKMIVDAIGRTILDSSGRPTRTANPVCDFAAVALAYALDVERIPDFDRTPEQWSSLREQVRQRLAEEELPELE